MYRSVAMLVEFGGLGTTSMLLYAVAICVIPLAIFWRPALAVYVLVPLMPLQTLRYQLQALPLGHKFVDVLLLAAIVGLFIHRNESGERVFPRTRLNGFLLKYCIFLYAMLWSGSYVLRLPWPLTPGDDRLADWKNFAEMPILFLVVTAVITTRKQMLTLLTLMMLTMLRANLGFYHTVSGRDFSHFNDNLRYSGVFGYAGQNGLAAFMAEFLVFLLAVAPAVKNLWLRVLVYSSILLSGFCLVFSFSRGGYVGLLGGLVVLGLMKDRKYLVLVVVLLATWQTIVPNAVRERVLMTYDEGKVESSANERLELWEDAATIIPQRPLLGTGFVTYRYLGRSVDYLDTHNYYVKVVVETGFVGLVLFIYLLWIMTREGIGLFRHSEDPFFKRLGLGLTVIMVCTVLVNCFGDRWMYQQITAYMWTFLALVVRARMLDQQVGQVVEDTQHELLPKLEESVA